MMRRFALLLAFVFALPLAAQTVGTESLLIGPGDQLHVQFYDTPELEQHPRVDDAGNAPLLFLGPVGLVGKTPQQAAGVIASLMVSRKFMSHPQVVVTIEQYATQEVTVSGEVGHPGNIMLSTPRPVLDVLAQAGGLNALADRHIVIQHRGGGQAAATPYFVSNDPKVQLADDVMIRPGDVVVVPRVGLVYILGDVGRPGGYPLVSNDARVTLLEALSNAGSTNKTAVISGVKLMRKTGAGYTQVPVHLGKIEAGKEPDPLLLADDVVIVPFSYAKNFILNGTGIAASVASAALYDK
jgi:polysaccharide export outer membrane protein